MQKQVRLSAHNFNPISYNIRKKEFGEGISIGPANIAYVHTLSH